MSQSVQIATGLLSAAAGVAFASATHYLRILHRPAEAAYARFHADDDTPTAAECEGTCEGSTEHEDDGDGGATCPGCGTPRRAPASDTA
ncbi:MULTISPECIES: hypothetical protein [Streptomyces]|uniref:Secreted protein n=1 Tax=Streptomyces europaeiscabiei TaxID=146819 RepID=A0ABU4NUK9_9ACTN|nr:MULTISPECIES: hypothetical protein [Streptomyces]MBP5922137.1 hypothetical protein [Streptomyces sp. LBUM 1483]MDX3555231.1 hypothetical protein [Streptomyces europaeiscabiei]MDX3705245.1 hypothetical protein [Streptomyces europaeiscabiei]MDX3864344.1 hypothetical protein [Streptomyces europaeiscabiei]MDX3871574.1 hypothetical protein [Streptomyces europaeiscabiei]